MKAHPSPTRSQFICSRGYSLIELLVVITIISILATLAFSATRAVLAQAYKVETETQLAALEVAVQSYFTEYNRLPGSGTTDETLRLNRALTSFEYCLATPLDQVKEVHRALSFRRLNPLKQAEVACSNMVITSCLCLIAGAIRTF